MHRTARIVCNNDARCNKMRRQRLFHWKWLVVVAFVIDFYQHSTRLIVTVAPSYSSDLVDLSTHTSSQWPSNTNMHTNTNTTHTLPRLVICGTVRNVQPHLAKIKKTVARLVKGKFELVKMVFFENNSTDGTVEELTSWSDTWNVTVLSEVLQEPERTVRLAHGRNRLWREISTLLPSLPNISYVLMMDMDDVNWHLSHAHECLTTLPHDWAVCCCNSYKVYYDLWALRTFGDDWMPCVGNSCSVGPHRKPFRHISALHEPIQVKSCFGGAALYKYSAVRSLLETNNPYVGLDDGGRPVCEHVSFHLLLESANASLYVQPAFLNDGPSDERMLYFGSVKKRLEPEYRESWKEAPDYYQHFWD
jgi:hypothetical protein